ncbi:SnoaL-like polyketide cyclase [Colletotrichum orchidophilum]|uniref:SnoaL-like polyketide cyclase n=1 Tax=Colletotrichum orchidophilum TaxID=1209926 RepID=A0A1G4B9T2_9PEZI|nr:SnoaL-like polyketide cyclase [Colletotrichum orchidophilum]OHE98151.1 SnoaL-like polyketide cyclase [Colletotrichum orchidophilum]
MSSSRKNLEATFRDIIDKCNSGTEEGLESVLHATVGFNGSDCLRRDFPERLNGRDGVHSTNVVKIDTILLDEHGRVAARLINKTTLRDTNKVFEYAEIIFADFTNNALLTWQTLRDEDGIQSQQSTIPVTPSPPSAVRSSSAMSSRDLKSFYQRYIDCINKKTMAEEFARFCQPELIHNDHKLSIAEYTPLISDSQHAIEGLLFTIELLFMDEETQQIAARLEFTGTPVQEWGGAKPNGKAVKFHEHVMYQLEDGKISRVWSVLELDAYRQQMI